MNQVVFMSYLSNSFSRRGVPTSPANRPREMSSGESSPPYEPSQPATASTSTPIRAEDLLGHRVSSRSRRCVQRYAMCALCGVLLEEHWAEQEGGRRGRASSASRCWTACSTTSACGSTTGAAASTCSATARAAPWSSPTSARSGSRPSGSPARPLDPLDPALVARARPERRPVALVTGFLGSGKTTLLSRAARATPTMGETAVIVNELGEVGDRPPPAAARRRAHGAARRAAASAARCAATSPTSCATCSAGATRGEIPAVPARRRRDDRARRPGADRLHAALASRSSSTTTSSSASSRRSTRSHGLPRAGVGASRPRPPTRSS